MSSSSISAADSRIDRRRRCLPTVAGSVLCLALCGPAFADATLGTTPMKGLAVRLLLDRYQAAGYALIYSSDLVRSHLVIGTEPPIGPPLERLEYVLREFQLGLKATDGGQHWLIVDGEVNATLVLAGRITDADSGEPLAGVRVDLAGATVMTKADGSFTVPVPSDAAKVTVSHDGYIGKVVQRPSWTDELDIPLNAVTAEVEEIIVISSRYHLQKAALGTKHSFNADELTAIPELGDDALRAVIHLPGTQSVGVSAKPYIRGVCRTKRWCCSTTWSCWIPFT